MRFGDFRMLAHLSMAVRLRSGGSEEDRSGDIPARWPSRGFGLGVSVRTSR